MHNNDKKTEIDHLMSAMTLLDNPQEFAAFFEDVCTPKEIQAMAQRLQVAVLLREGKTFTDIVSLTGASSTTISRVSRCLQSGAGGYRTVLDRMDTENK